MQWPMDIGNFSEFFIKYLKVIKVYALTLFSIPYIKSPLILLLTFCFYYAIMKCRHTGIPRLWTQELYTGLWTLDSERWSVEAELLQTVDYKTLKFKTAQSLRNNGAISITSFLNCTLIKIFGHFRYENLSTVYLFQATLSNLQKMSKTTGFQMMWRGKLDLK